MDIRAVFPLDEETSCRAAMRRTGLHDFGDERWRQPFRILIAALDTEAELTLMGRLIARSDLLIALANRLAITEVFRRHPQIATERLEQVTVLRDAGAIPTAAIADVRYRDLLADLIAVVRILYAQFGMPLSAQTVQRRHNYVRRTPQDKFGRHLYDITASTVRERPLFERYQRRHHVPSEV